jgi:large conductance mechanosensitive channel
MSFIKEFRDFAIKGNMVDLAIGVIIGAAFSKIITSLIEDIITPLLLKPAMDTAHINNIQELKWGSVKYGSFISNIIQFLIVAMVLFMTIKAINRMKRKEEAKAPEPTQTELLLTEIRDLLKKQ